MTTSEETVAEMLKWIANAITDVGATAATDDHGGRVACLTEAALSVGKSLDGIAGAIGDLAEAIRERNN